jgi:predicted RNase H-like HicB family nuclease
MVSAGEEVVLMKYPVVLEPSEEGFAVSVLGLPGCRPQGVIRRKALTHTADAIRGNLEVVAELKRGKAVRKAAAQATPKSQNSR